jgi:hypothetical protein
MAQKEFVIRYPIFLLGVFVQRSGTLFQFLFRYTGSDYSDPPITSHVRTRFSFRLLQKRTNRLYSYPFTYIYIHTKAPPNMKLSLAVLLAGSISGGGEAFSSPARPRPANTLSFSSRGSKPAIITTLYASTVVDASVSALMLNGNNKPPGWHRRMIRRIFRRGGDGRQQHSSASSSTNTRAIAISHQSGYDDLAALQRQERNHRFLAIFRGRNRPLELAMPRTTTVTKTSAAAITAATTVLPRDKNALSRTFYAKWLERTVENNLVDRFDRWTAGMHTNLQIRSELQRPAYHVVSGILTCNVNLSADRLVFGAFQCSGGRLTAHQMSINLLSFTKLGQQQRPHHHRYHRYPNAFDFHVDQLILTQRDLLESSCIRNGLRRLLTLILNRSLSRTFWAQKNGNAGSTDGVVAVEIRSIEIIPSSGEIQVRGVVSATAVLLSPIAFSVKTRLGVSGRGHILTFPGLEIFLLDNDIMRLPIPNITVDLGHNAQLFSIDTTTTTTTTTASSSPPRGGGDPPSPAPQPCLRISAKVRITPEHTRVDALSKYQQSSASFGSVCSVDVGAWLTGLGRFSS